MDILDQKLGTVGEVSVSVVAGKLAISIEGDVDLVAQLEKLKAAHSTGILPSIINVAEAALKALTPAAAPAAPAADAAAAPAASS